MNETWYEYNSCDGGRNPSSILETTVAGGGFVGLKGSWSVGCEALPFVMFIRKLVVQFFLPILLILLVITCCSLLQIHVQQPESRLFALIHHKISNFKRKTDYDIVRDIYSWNIVSNVW